MGHIITDSKRALECFNSADAILKDVGFICDYASPNAPVNFYLREDSPYAVMRVSAIAERNRNKYALDKRIVSRLTFTPHNIPHNEFTLYEMLYRVIGRYIVGARKEELRHE